MVLQDGSRFCQSVYVGRKDVFSSIESAVCIAKVINQQKNDVGFFVLGIHADGQQGHQKKWSSLAQG